MQPLRQQPAPEIRGTLMQSRDGHRVAFYVRNGAVCVAEFRNGRAELSDATTWFRVSARAMRSCDGRDTRSLTPEIIESIEALHLEVEASDARAAQSAKAAFAAMRHCCIAFAGWIRHAISLGETAPALRPVSHARGNQLSRSA